MGLTGLNKAGIHHEADCYMVWYGVVSTTLEISDRSKVPDEVAYQLNFPRTISSVPR